MKSLSQLCLVPAYVFLALCSCALLLTPSAAFAQSNINVCSNATNSILKAEETVCIVGNLSNLTGYAVVQQDLAAKPPVFLGVDAQMFSGGQMVASSGEPGFVSGGYEYEQVTVVPTQNQTYTLTGALNSCPFLYPTYCAKGLDWTYGIQGGISVSATPPVFINPKYVVIGVTYAPPGPSSYVQYTGTTSVGNTTTFASSFSDDIGFSVSMQNTTAIEGWGPKGTVNGTSSTDYTQGSNNSTTTTLSKLTSLSYKTGGTGYAFAPANSDYDIIWIWLNPVLLLNYTPPTSNTVASIQWDGYGYDTNDPSGTQQPDVYPVYVGYLNGDFGNNTGINTVLARGWASSANGYIWPAGEGPGLTAADFSEILKSDPFAGCAYNNNAVAWSSCQYASSDFQGLPPSTTPDGRFTIVTLPNNPNPINYIQAAPGNGGGLTTQYSVNQTNTQSVAQGTSSSTKQTFSVEEVFGASTWWDSLQYTLKESNTLTWTNSWLNTLTQTTTLQQALSVIGPNCPALPGPCTPEYAGPNQFVVYQDNQYGTFMFYPTY